MRDRIRRRADMEESDFWTDAEINNALDDSLFAFYDFLVNTFEDEYFHAETDITSVAGQNAYSLPADFYKLLGVDVKTGSTSAQVFSVPKYMFSERNTRRDGNFLVQDYRYRLRGSTIHFIPPPQAGLTFTVHYIPAFQGLAADGSTFDAIHRWHEWPILKTVIKMLESEESDTMDFYRDLKEEEARIITMRADRDSGSPDRVTDVEGVQADEDLLFRRGT